MLERITLEQFRQIKNQLIQLVQEVDDYFDSHSEEENFDFELGENKFIEQYTAIQNQLFNYDLSAIPFEEWQGMQLISDETHIVDLSKTKANIDFAIVEYHGNGNFKNCNVKNLDKIERFLDPNSFDEKTIQINSSLFLSDSFTSEFKDKYYSNSLTIDDLAKLSSDQIDEIMQKDYLIHMPYNEYNSLMLKTLGLNKVLQLYNYSQSEYKEVYEIMNMNFLSMYEYSINDNQLPDPDEFLEHLKSVDITDIKHQCYEFIRNRIVNSDGWLSPQVYPESFVKENSDLFLINVDIPDDVKHRYFLRSLTIGDLLDYPEAFQTIPIDFFMDSSIDIFNFARNHYEIGKLQQFIQKHSDVFEHLIQDNEFYLFINYLNDGNNLERDFTEAIKIYSLKTHRFVEVIDGEKKYNIPDWLSSMNFKFVDELSSPSDLFQYDDSTFVLDSAQRKILYAMNIDNIIRFEKETGFFSHKGSEWAGDLEMFNAIREFFILHEGLGLNFKNGSLSYDEFSNELASFLDKMRANGIFAGVSNYDWLQGDFRKNHPEIFMDLSAPAELRDAFYKNKIELDYIYQHPEYIRYLMDKNLLNTISADIKISYPGLTDNQGNMVPYNVSFIKKYVEKYGNENLLNLIVKYGTAMSDLTIINFNNELENEQLIEKAIRKAIYNKIMSGTIDYSFLANVPEMMAEHPEIFVDFSGLNSISQEQQKKLEQAFYSKSLTFDDIKKYPELVHVLKDKNLLIAFGHKDGEHYNGRVFLNQGYTRSIEKNYSDLELLEVFGNEKFLQLCSKYGRYMDGIVQYLNKDVTIRNGKYIDFSRSDIDFEKGLSFEEITERIEQIIIRESKLGNIDYNPEDAPAFIRETHPELFLNDDAPEELKKYFYNYCNNYPMTFEVLKRHKDWLPYLKDKSLTTALLRRNYLKKELIQYLELFGDERAIKLGINRAETVIEMMKSHQVDLMKKWYDKTGGKFIPDFVVMQNFSFEEADKFLASGSNWSNLMRIKSFSQTPETRDAMLKLAYSFGAFDQDQRGYKKLQDLLTDLPRKIDSSYSHIMDGISSIENCRIMEGSTFGVPQGYEEYMQLKEMLKKEGFKVNPEQEVFSQIYRKNEDGSYSLTINSQSYPKSIQLIRTIMEIYPDAPILTPNKAHQLFGGFELKYDPDFREFLLKNMDNILEKPENIRYVSSIQKQFSEIKAINSNRLLTWDLAVSFVQTNKYNSVNVGNERVAEISSIAGYTQSDFSTLQQIYNYGKQRTFSSIPRIESSVEKRSGKYKYEILRLDDPLAMAIGTLTDCCQELGNCAEICMEHSMVDKHGRVFVIRDEQDNIVAQSWVWRNKDVLCFDNIEIPDKAFTRAVKGHSELGRKGFTDEVFEVYKQAARDLMEEDDKVYKELLETGKINQEQYDGLRLGKVTVGVGYNDIADSLKQNSEVDRGTVSRPLPFDEPVKLSRGLYTNDSNTQYVLEERDDRKQYDGDTLPVHSDSFVEYTDENLTGKTLLSLEKLELLTKENPRWLETSVDDDVDKEHLVTELAHHYRLNPETTKIIMNPNFAIIYDVNDNKLKVGDLLFNTKIDNGQQQMDIENQVIMQIRLALDQISADKEIDISSLNNKQQEMYKKVMGLKDEMDVERGVGHAK